ncbi:DMT family transporter [Tissierella creatinini]|nr:DMT family transporter [Tissierella creatinini]TJX60843.1 DMT family transporter [Soehngenia saccharolytica]
MKLGSSQKGSSFVLLAVILWSVMGFIIKTVEASPIWILIIRSFIGGLCLLPFIFKEKIYPLKNVVITSICMALFFISFTITTRISSSAMAIAMQTAAPMYVIGYGFYKKQKIDIKKLIILILIFLGVFLNVLSSYQSSNTLVMFIGLAIGICFALYSANMQKIKNGSVLGIVALVNLMTTIIYLLILPFNYSSPPTSLRDLLLLSFAGVMVSGLSYAAYGAGLRQIPIEKAMIIGLAEPILNPIWVFLGTGEIPEPMVIVGLVFILLGAFADIFS